MILTILSSSQNQDLQKLQNHIKNKFNDKANICCDFVDSFCEHCYTEISILFTDNQIECFYALPRFDASDKIQNVSFNDYRNLLLDVYDFFTGEVLICFHLLYSSNNAPFKKIINLFPKEYLNDKNYSKSISALSEKITCCAQISPQEYDNKILINFETFDPKIATVSNFITINNSEPFIENESLINNFFNLLTYLYNNERNEVING